MSGKAKDRGKKKPAAKKAEKEDDGTDINLAEGRISIAGTKPDKVQKERSGVDWFFIEYNDDSFLGIHSSTW